MIPWNQQRPSISIAFSATALQGALEWFGEELGKVDTSKYLLIVNARYHMFKVRELWGEQNYLWSNYFKGDTWVLIGEKGVYWSEL